ncbi:MAG: ATP-binding cassette domain-containing protein [Acidimicrobiaceae bacterium]|nr:ATP-binding cassette domain-containing protein [Acidimicrobiaceae bacterium]MCY4280792.1 ATP-binding cassette domain-containing protein [Acidimicrobiaceae bacterium]MCY4295237.1 ATP-binding cassette domain-containing protein [Acidimicrobiaceae bacterium]
MNEQSTPDDAPHNPDTASAGMPREPGADTTALVLRGVGRVVEGRPLLVDVDWQVRSSQRWVVLGANGSGKTTLVRIATMWDHPSAGDVELLGQRLGQTDVRRLRSRVGFTGAAVAALLRPSLTAAEVVMTAKHAALAPWWHHYDADDAAGARAALQRVGCGDRCEQRFGTLSSGEQQRVLLARALSIEPGLVVLDEPNAGLDLAGREQLISTLAQLALDPLTPPLVLVTHHTDEIPDGFSHVLMLRDGAVLAAGPMAETMTSENLSACFGLRLSLERRHGRWVARAARD